MSKVISFKDKKKENIEKKKRSFERLVLNDMTRCGAVIDDAGTHYSVKLIDISYDGCLIQIPYKDAKHKLFQIDNEIDLRFYFTESSYIPARVRVKHSHSHQEVGRDYERVGCEFDKTATSFVALEKFIEFLYKYAEFSIIDKGDEQIYFL